MYASSGATSRPITVAIDAIATEGNRLYIYSGRIQNIEHIKTKKLLNEF